MAVYENAFQYETVAASQTARVIGTTGAAKDFIARLIIVPASVSPGVVALLDDTTSINLLPGGSNSLTELKPIVVELNMRSVNGPWKVTTGASVSVIAVGYFS